jgi:hypothetical protein
MEAFIENVVSSSTDNARCGTPKLDFQPRRANTAASASLSFWPRRRAERMLILTAIMMQIAMTMISGTISHGCSLKIS